MPIYEYQRNDCGAVSDYLLPINENKPRLVCTHCCGTRLDRQISTPALVKNGTHVHGKTYCGRDERCQTPPCSTGEKCRR